MSDPGGFHPLRKTKKVLLSLRSRSSSDDRSDSENLGLEYKEALRLAKEKSRRGDDQGYNTGAIAKIKKSSPFPVASVPNILFPPGYPGFDQKGVNANLHENYQRRTDKTLSSHTHADPDWDNYDFNEEIYPDRADRAQIARKHREYFPFDFGAESGDSARSVLRPKRVKAKPRSYIDFEELPALTAVAHANITSSKKLPATIVQRMALNGSSDDDSCEDLGEVEANPDVREPKAVQPNPTLRNILKENKDIFGTQPQMQPGGSAPIMDPNVRAMMSSPQARLMFDNWANANTVRRGDTLEGPSSEQIVTVSRDIRDVARKQKRSIKEEVIKQLGLYYNSCKAEDINKYYTYHSKVGGVSPPTTFSTNDTLHIPVQLRNCNSSFPLTKPFTGDPKGPDICTFLRQMTKAQRRVTLSRQEFLEILLESCRKPALDRIQPLVGMDYPIDTLYSILVSTFDELISPGEAHDLLSRYKAHKSKTIHKVNSDLSMIATRAAQEYSSKEVSREYFDEETCKALVRCLPEKASRKAKALQAEMRQKMGRKPTFNEFSCAIANTEEDLDVEIRKYGVDTKEMENISLNKSQRKSESTHLSKPASSKESGKTKKGKSFYKEKYTSGNVHQVTGDLKALNLKPQSRVNEVKSGNKPYHIKLGNNDRLQCLLCNQKNHQTSDGCLCMFTDSGIHIPEAAAVSSNCVNCKEKLGKELKHAAKFCPIRDRALELYTSGKVLPRGLFRQYCVDNKIGTIKPWTSHDYSKGNQGNSSRNSNHNSNNGKRNGNVQMISVSNLIADLPLPDKDFHVFTIDTQQKDTFGAKLYLDVTATCPYPNVTSTLTCLIDTGSDSCLISRSYLGTAFNMRFDEVECHLQESDLNLLSYTNDNINISGKIDLDIKIPYTNKSAKLTFYVVDDLFKKVNSVTPMLIGLSALVKMSVILDSKPSSAMGQIPILYSKHDKNKSILSKYMTTKDLAECHTLIDCLEPKESKAFYFYIDHFYNFQPGHTVLISDDFLQPGTNPIPLQIMLTRSELVLDKEKNKLRGVGFIVNHGITEYRNLKIVGFFEGGGDYKLNEVDGTAYNENNSKKVILPYPDAFIHDKLNPPFLNKYSRKYPNLHKVSKTSSTKEIKILESDQALLGSASPISILPQSIYKVNKIDTYFPEDVNIRAIPKSINNGQGTKNISLSDERQLVKETSDSDPSKIALFNDAKQTCQLGQATIDDGEDFMLTGAGAARGYSIPNQSAKDELTLKTEFLNLDQYEPLIRGHVEDIFLKKHSSIIATSSLSRGDMSRTLGTYSITLKEGVELPKHKKVYFVAPMEALQLQAILEFLLKNGTIVKANIGGDTVNEFSSPGYLIPKNKPDSAPRLVINFQAINQVIAAEPAILPSADSIIHGLRDAYFYSVNDISNAFHSVSIDAASRELTAFSVPVGGTYQHTCLPTGMKTSPEALNRIMHKAIHFKPDFDKNGKEQWNKDKTLKMVYDPIPQCQFLYDDILCWSTAKETYELSVKEHFRILEKVISRLDYHQCKIGVHKSQLCKTYINFFGYYISNKYVIADPARIKKLMDAPEPHTRKEARSFLGVVNSMREQLGFTIIKHTGSLQKLTSSTKTKDKFNLDEEQKADFLALKAQLKEGPIFSKIIDLTAPKLIFSDMAGQTEGACYGATLCQIVHPKEGQVSIPAYLDLEDPCHRIVYDLKVMARPLPNRIEGQDLKTYLKQTDAVPPAYFYQLKEKYLGYTEKEAPHSLSISLKLFLAITNCGVTFENILKGISEAAREEFYKASFLDFIFNHDKKAYWQYIKDLEAGTLVIDKKLFIIRLLSEVMFRPIVVLSSTKDFPQRREFNSSAYKPAMYLFLYKVDDMYIVKPALSDKTRALNLANFRGCLEVVSYIAKPISENHKHLHIIDLELQGIMHALSSFRKLVGQSECVLVTDSQGLYFLFNSLNLKTNKRLNRWNYSLLEIMPQLQIFHCTTDDMLCDFLTRQYKVPEGPTDFTLLKLNRFDKKLYDSIVPNIAFTLSEWKDFVDKHKDMIRTLNDCEGEVKISHVSAIKHTVKAVASVLTPAAILKRKLSPQTIIIEQRLEYKDLYEECSAAPNHELIKGKKTYILHNGLICILEDGKYLTLCPTNILPIFVSYAHLLTAHGGEARVKLNLTLVFHPDKNKLIKNFCRACHNCQMTNCNTHLNEVGTYPTATRAMECISVDYIENLPKNKYQFKHACIMTCYLTGAIIAVPTRTLEAHEFLRIFLFNAYQTFSPKQVLCDGAKAFLSIENLVVLASLGVRVLEASAHNARGKGTVERVNGILKSAIMKTFGSKEDNGWVYALPCIVRQLNSTLSPKTGYAPIDLLFGLGVSESIKHFNMLPQDQLHSKAQNYYQRVADGHEEKVKALVEVNKKVQGDRVKRVEKLNTFRSKKDIQVDDFVFVKNFSGANSKSTAFRQIFYPTPYRVIKVSPVTAVVQRLSDHFDTKLHFDHLKPFKTLDKAFDFLPIEIKNIVRKDFTQLTDKEIAIVCENSTFEIPTQSMSLEEHDPHFLANIDTIRTNDNVPDTEIQLDNIEPDSESDSEENTYHRRQERRRTQNLRYDPEVYVL